MSISASVDNHAWSQLTERSRKAVRAAEKQAVSLGHIYVSDVHLLLGLLDDAEHPACRLIIEQGIGAEALRARLQAFLADAKKQPRTLLTLTPRARRILEIAGEAAQESGRLYIGTEHLLLGIVRESRGAAARLLSGSGFTLEVLRQSAETLGERIPDISEENARIGLLPVCLAKGKPAESSVTAHRSLLRPLLQGLSRSHPVRRAAEAFLENRTPPEDAVSELLETLNRPSCYTWREGVVAVWLLGRIPLTEAEAQSAMQRLSELLIAWPRQEGRKRMKRSVWVALVGSGAVLLALNSIAPIPWSRVGWPMLILFGALFFPFVWMGLSVVESGEQYIRAQAAQTLGALGRVESIAALATASLEGSAIEVRNWARWSLQRVLPRLTSYHYGRLPGQPCTSLCRLLWDADEPLALAVLHALRDIGDGSAVTTVEKISVHAPSLAVQAEARRILPLLRVRQAQENSSQALLRASTAPQDAAEVLLRPAGEGTGDNPDHLLRPDPGSQKP